MVAMQRKIHGHYIVVSNYLHLLHLSLTMTAPCCPRVVNTWNAGVRDVG